MYFTFTNYKITIIIITIIIMFLKKNGLALQGSVQGTQQNQMMGSGALARHEANRAEIYERGKLSKEKVSLASIRLARGPLANS